MPEAFSPVPSHAPPTVSIENQMPQDLFDAMREFIRLHPQWDQYRLMQAALAGFLFQHGAKERAVARHYLDGLFHGTAAPPLPPETAGDREARPQTDSLRPKATTLHGVGPGARKQRHGPGAIGL